MLSLIEFIYNQPGTKPSCCTYDRTTGHIGPLSFVGKPNAVDL